MLKTLKEECAKEICPVHDAVTILESKNSIANLIKEAIAEKNIAINEYNMISIHIYNDGVDDVESLIQLIIENLLKLSENKKWGEGIWNAFSNHVESVNIFGANIRFKSRPEEKEIIKNIKYDFANFLYELSKKIDDKNGIFIIIDDINGLSKTPEFANWFKSFTETLTSLNEPVPIAFMLLTTKEKLYKLNMHNPSFKRIFHQKEITTLKKSEVENFFIKSFEKIDMSIDNEALDLIVFYSSGQPAMMQEIGDAIYWTCEKENISKNDALIGIFKACDEVGVKYLEISSDNKITNEKYQSIYKKLGKFFIGTFDTTFDSKYFLHYLNDDEKQYFADFFITSIGSGLLEFDGGEDNEKNYLLSELNDDEKEIFGKIILLNSNILSFDYDFDFKKDEINQELNNIEKKVLQDFLIKAKKSRILEFSYDEEIGIYRFTNKLFPLYCIIKFIESEHPYLSKRKKMRKTHL